MKPTLNPQQFLDLPERFTDFNTASVAILPIPYEGGVSWGAGAAGGPDAVITASKHLEVFDEVLNAEPYRMGITTVSPPPIPIDAQQMETIVQDINRALIERNKLVVMLGGDHSISVGGFKALRERHPTLAVIQLDAHADLRDRYEGNPFSHACVMARIRQLTDASLQIGIRSMSVEEARRIEAENLPLCTMTAFRSGQFDVDAALDALPGPVYLTVDVDVFDWSVIRSTGTPEPGGLLWDEALSLLYRIFRRKNVIGIDVVELSAAPHDPNSAFAAAKLIYKMLGFKLAVEIERRGISWPKAPRCDLFRPAI